MARIAKALDKLRAQLQTLAPQVPKGEFGWIASPEHHEQNPNSDHEADPVTGVVRALDVPHYPRLNLDVEALMTHLRQVKDPRIRYAIWNKQIFGDEGYARRNNRIAWKLYPAANHEEHGHVSVNKETEDDDRDWNIGGVVVPPGVPPTSYPEIERGATGTDVKVLQYLLFVDGKFGPLTEYHVMEFQERHGLDPDGIVGPETWAALSPVPGPPPTEPPPTTEGVHRGITATVFGGNSETERSAYDNHVITESESAVALPFRFSGTRPKVKVTNPANGKSVICTIEDVGPWLTDDPYWQTNSRPIAESNKPLPRGPNKGRVSNKAGIDLSPAAARAIGISGKGLVDWQFV